MPTLQPTISIIIPVHDRLQKVRRAVQSILRQTYTNFELHLIDDGSTPPLNEVQELVQSRGHFYHRTENRGVSHARNFGIRHSNSDWLAFLDSDDEWFPYKLERQVAFHRDNPNCKISQTLEEWHRNGKRVNPKKHHEQPDGEAFKASLDRCVISPSSVLIHRDIFQKVGLFDESLPVCEDYDLWLRITSRFEVRLLPEFLIRKYGGHSDQLSRSQPAMDRFRLYAILKLLVNDKDLSSLQFEQALGAAREKARILRIGSEKRTSPMLSRIEDIEECLSEGKVQEAFQLGCELLREVV